MLGSSELEAIGMDGLGDAANMFLSSLPPGFTGTIDTHTLILSVSHPTPKHVRVVLRVGVRLMALPGDDSPLDRTLLYILVAGGVAVSLLLAGACIIYSRKAFPGLSRELRRKSRRKKAKHAHAAEKEPEAVALPSTATMRTPLMGVAVAGSSSLALSSDRAPAATPHLAADGYVDPSDVDENQV